MVHVKSWSRALHRTSWEDSSGFVLPPSREQARLQITSNPLWLVSRMQSSGNETEPGEAPGKGYNSLAIVELSSLMCIMLQSPDSIPTKCQLIASVSHKAWLTFLLQTFNVMMLVMMQGSTELQHKGWQVLQLEVLQCCCAWRQLYPPFNQQKNSNKQLGQIVESDIKFDWLSIRTDRLLWLGWGKGAYPTHANACSSDH